MSLGECREALPSPLWLASGATLRRPPLRGNQPGARASAAAFVRPVVGCRVLLEETTAPKIGHRSTSVAETVYRKQHRGRVGLSNVRNVLPFERDGNTGERFRSSRPPARRGVL